MKNIEHQFGKSEKDDSYTCTITFETASYEEYLKIQELCKKLMDDVNKFAKEKNPTVTLEKDSSFFHFTCSKCGNIFAVKRTDCTKRAWDPCIFANRYYYLCPKCTHICYSKESIPTIHNLLNEED